jgi:hypothetical protein
MNKKLLIIPVVIVLLVAGFAAYNYYFHVFNNGGNGTAQCISYLRGDCVNSATFSSPTDTLTVYGVGQETKATWYNVAFAYAPAVASLNSQYGPIGATFQTSSALSNNVLNSGQTLTVTFDSINASAPTDSNGYNGIIWAAYTTSNSGSACSGPSASLTGCSFFEIATITLTQ